MNDTVLETPLVWLLNRAPRPVRDGILRGLENRVRRSLNGTPSVTRPWPVAAVDPPVGPLRVVVIGAGVGGTAIAALLARQGHRVTLLENNHRVGGRATRESCQGFTFDVGVHLCGRGATGPAARVAREVGADLRWRGREMSFLLRCGDRSRAFRRDIKDLGELAALAGTAGVPFTAMAGASRTLGGAMFASQVGDVASLDGVTVRDYLARFTDDPAVVQLMEVMCLLLLCVPPDEASAGEFVWCFSNLARAGHVSYPIGGVQEVPVAYIRAMERHGGALRTGTPARRIVVHDGRAVGVETDSGLLPADWVISNAGIKNTMALTGEGHFPGSYVRRVSELVESFSAVTIKYGLDHPLLRTRAVVDYDPHPRISSCFEGPEPACPVAFLVAPEEPGQAPLDTQLVIAGALHPRAALSGDGERRALDMLHQRVRRILPGLEDHLVMREETGARTIAGISGRASADVVGIAQRHDQVGAHRPDVTTPVGGLFLVGCDAGGRGVGIEQAADSALNLAHRLGA